jgi:hypothetical protein
VEGLAQVVLDEKEGMEGKVVRMLGGGLSTHIKDYRLESERLSPKWMSCRLRR